MQPTFFDGAKTLVAVAYAFAQEKDVLLSGAVVRDDNSIYLKIR